MIKRAGWVAIVLVGLALAVVGSLMATSESRPTASRFVVVQSGSFTPGAHSPAVGLIFRVTNTGRETGVAHCSATVAGVTQSYGTVTLRAGRSKQLWMLFAGGFPPGSSVHCFT